MILASFVPNTKFGLANDITVISPEFIQIIAKSNQTLKYALL